jgi:threonine/homoserine/homoserine lactone efflux protein
MLWLAWKIANATKPGAAAKSGKPLTFVQSAGFQWVNPKAWTMALGAIALYATNRDLTAILWVSGIYVLMGCVSTTVWVALGQQMRRLLSNPTHLRAFNIAMALLLVASLVPVLF